MQSAVRVTHQTGHVLTPTAGPGDQELAFLSDRGGHANLWVVNVGNGTLRQITNEREPNVIVGVPVWSPAGGSIAFVSSRPPSDAPSDLQLAQSRPTLGIWLVNRDGSNLRNIVKVGVGPSWSPDGRWLYYTPRLPEVSSRLALKGEHHRRCGQTSSAT